MWDVVISDVDTFLIFSFSFLFVRDTINFITKYLQINIALTWHNATLTLKIIILQVRLVNYTKLKTQKQISLLC
jgi:hypothetical protein